MCNQQRVNNGATILDIDMTAMTVCVFFPFRLFLREI